MFSTKKMKSLETRRKISQNRKGKGMGNKNGLGKNLGNKNAVGKKRGVSHNSIKSQQKQKLLAGREKSEHCEICYRPSSRIDFDHDHSTGKFRGWLCRRCNLVLGGVHDDISLLKNMVIYLENNNDEMRPPHIFDSLLNRFTINVFFRNNSDEKDSGTE